MAIGGAAMPRLIPPIVTALAISFAALAGEVVYQGDLTPLNITPTFDKGYLAVYQSADTISLYRPDGSLAHQATARAPYSTWNHVVNAAPDADGSIALAVEYNIGKSRRGGVAVFDTGEDWWPAQVCFGQDHSIWAIGWRGLGGRDTGADYFVLRNYARDGTALGAFLPRSSFEQDPVGPMTGGWQLREANNRIGALFYRSSALPLGAKRRIGQWIEMDLHGNILRKVDVPKKIVWAFASNGALYARGFTTGYSALVRARTFGATFPGFPASTFWVLTVTAWSSYSGAIACSGPR
jgi:hypothetical protein